MEHLPWAAHLTISRPRTLFLCANFEESICDGLTKLTLWPLIQGWQMHELSMEDGVRHCQAWLFFGLIKILTIAIGDHFNIHDYVDPYDSRYVDSTKLRKLFDQAYKKLFDRDLNFKEEPLAGQVTTLIRVPSSLARDVTRAIKDIMQRYSTWLMRLACDLEALAASSQPLQCEMLNTFHATIMLFELFLENQCDRAPDSYCAFMRCVRESMPLLSRRSLYLTTAYRMVGRCPTVLQRTEMSLLNAYRVLQLPYGGEHRACHDRICQAFGIDESQYRMQHTADCGSSAHCATLRINASTLEYLVRTDAAPLVRSFLSAADNLDVEVVDGRSIEEITAISHVWAGGLGNFIENAHFACQLLRLHKAILSESWLIRRRSSVVYYWLDTLCIPARPSIYKTMAINAMAAVYARAEAVLVIDPILMKTNTNGLTPCEIDLAVLSAPWMARSWTLQEGALSVDLRFVFANRTISLAQIDHRKGLSTSSMLRSLWLRDFEPNTVSENVSGGIQNYLNRAFKLVKSNVPYDPEKEGWLNIWNDLCSRDSTKLDDIAAILAIFLGRSAGEVLSLPSSARMHALIRTQTRLPVSLLFVQTENIKHWTPTFPTCRTPSSLLVPDQDFMELTADGYFSIKDTKSLKIIQCTRELRPTGEIALQSYTETDVWAFALRIRFTTLADDLNAATPAMANLVFLLPESSTKPWQSEWSKGMCLEMMERTSKCTSLRFLSTIDWQAEDPGVHHNGIDGTFSDASSDKRHLHSAAPYHHRGIMWSASLHDDSFSLLLNMGITWPKLAWTRPSFFPFLPTVVSITQFLELGLCLAALEASYILLYLLLMWCNTLEHDRERSWITVVVHTAILLGFNHVRFLLGTIEYSWLKKRSHRSLQRIWAVSFKPSAAQNQPVRLLNAKDRQVLALTAAGYVVLWFLSGYGVIIYCSNMVQKIKNSPPRWQAYVVYPIALFFGGELYKPLVFFTFTNITVRALAAALYLRRLHIAPRRIDLNRDARHAWVKKAVATIIIVFVSWFAMGILTILSLDFKKVLQGRSYYYDRHPIHGNAIATATF